jgi:hypothetical protein
MVFGINTLLVLVMVRTSDTAGFAGLGTIVIFVAAAGAGSFVATVLTPVSVRRWGRYTTANAALLFAAVIQLSAATLQLGIMVACGFFLGVTGQVVKLCADSAMQIDVDDAMRGHVFAVQDSLFWMSFIVAVSAAAAVIPADGRSPALALVGSGVYLVGLAVHARIGRLQTPMNQTPTD